MPKGCLDCRFYYTWQESRPYGSTVAYENFAECKKADEDELGKEELMKLCETGFPIDDCSSFEVAPEEDYDEN